MALRALIPQPEKTILQSGWAETSDGDSSDSRQFPRNLRGNHLLSSFKENLSLKGTVAPKTDQGATALPGREERQPTSSTSGLNHPVHSSGCKFSASKDLLRITLPKSGLSAEVLKNV